MRCPRSPMKNVWYYAQPVGGVVAYEKQISISGVGFDIGCGNMAVRLDTKFSEIEDSIGPIIKDIAKVVSLSTAGDSNAHRVRTWAAFGAPFQFTVRGDERAAVGA